MEGYLQPPALRQEPSLYSIIENLVPSIPAHAQKAAKRIDFVREIYSSILEPFCVGKKRSGYCGRGCVISIH